MNWNNKEEVLKKIEEYKGSLIIQDIGEDLKNDKEVILAAAKSNYLNLSGMDKALKKDKNFLKELQFNYFNEQAILEFADSSLKEDKNFCKDMIEKNLDNFKYADFLIRKELNNDYNLFYEGFKNGKNGKNLMWASKDLQDDKEIVLAAVKNNKNSLRFAGSTIQEEVKEVGSIDKWISKTEKELNNTKTKENPFAKKIKTGKDKNLGR